MEVKKYKLKDFILLLNNECSNIKNSMSYIVEVEGTIKSCKMFRNKVGISFKLIDGSNSITCKGWNKNIRKYSGVNIEKIELSENQKCLVRGKIQYEYWSGMHNFVLELVEDIKNDESHETELIKLKKDCIKYGYFNNKRSINWSIVNKIGIISKSNSQGYNDFISQYVGIKELLLREISLEGKETETTLINSIKYLEDKCDVILVVRGGGDTSNISLSFDKLSIFKAIRECKLPIVTAIGHADDKDDKLLITKVSDYDYPTPSSLVHKLNKILLEPYIKFSEEFLLEKKTKLTDLLSNKRLKYYTLLEDDIETKMSSILHGSKIVDITTEKYIIIHSNGKYYKMKINLDNEIKLSSNVLQTINNINKYIKLYDINKLKIEIAPFITNYISKIIKKIENVNKSFNKLEKYETVLVKELHNKDDKKCLFEDYYNLMNIVKTLHSSDIDKIKHVIKILSIYM